MTPLPVRALACALLTAVVLNTGIFSAAPRAMASTSPPPANMLASVTAPAGFPFPANFHATHAIAVYDDNHNGALDPVIGTSVRSFPVGQPSDGTPAPGTHIGSFAMLAPPGSSPEAVAVLNGEGRFCADSLAYGEQLESNPGSLDTVYFIWVAWRSQSFVPRPGCNESFTFDFGIGSYRGTWRSPSQVHQASLYGGIQGGASSGSIHLNVGQPGTFANPGQVLSASPDMTQPLPVSLNGLVAAEITSSGDLQVPFNSLTIDVPFVLESQWDGASLFATQYPVARTVHAASPPLTVHSASLWSTAMSDAAWPGPYSLEQYSSIKFADVDGDGVPDLCYRVPAAPLYSAAYLGIFCAHSDGQASFATPSRWSTGFVGGYWSTDESYWGTIQYADLNGDGKADICGRGREGIYCARSNGAGFETPTLWSAVFSDANGWNQLPSYWQTIHLVDVNGDGLADVCARGAAGIYCALSTGSSFGAPSLWSAQFGNANGWGSDQYWKTITYGDLNGDGRADICGRGVAGVICATSTGWSFGTATLWTTQFSDANGWQQPQYYSTIRLADVNADGKADVCGRGSGGFYCAVSTGSSFSGGFNLVAPEFSDANGWSAERFYRSLFLVDVNRDGNVDICGRGYDGILCALSMSVDGDVAFRPAVSWVNNFGDVYGWGQSASYWSTVQPVGVRFCGRGVDGILCSTQ